MRPGVAWGLWALLIGLSATVAPPVRPDALAWSADLIAGRWGEEDPTILAHFNLMGLWPPVLAALLAPRLRATPVPLWPFVLGAAALGAFALLPGLALAGPPRERPGRVEAALVAPPWLALLGVAAVGLGVWGLLTGDVAAWEARRAREGFVYIMTLDFGVLWLASLLVAREQGLRLGVEQWRFAAVPLAGALAWVAVRERLSAGEESA